MVDQVTIQTIGVLVAASSVLIGVVYYILQMREQNKNRQAQLFMQIYNHYLDKITDDARAGQ
jgi:sensor domain CHASE-containing protein